MEVEVRERAMPALEIVSSQGVEEMDINIKDMLSGLFWPDQEETEDDRC